ncbi:Mitochondrial ribonuclease P protein [Apis cerana cerana]|uniref:Mitochondrial ribonuclease P catalytic subunit n=1 Tax=Apis cerana cerana TaxID=94128 RepID=A0A2A3EQK1_APICC|nr:Mitochondrial ribonuclease P protein [Apis cerana cerana]
MKRNLFIYINKTKQFDTFWNYLTENYKNVLVEPSSTSKEIWKKDNNYNPTVHTITRYLKLYHLKNDLITETDKKHILSIYNKLMIQYTSFNANISNTFVKSLCQINQWKEAIKVIEKYEAIDNNHLLQEAYNDLISYLFDHEQEKLAYEYLINSMKKKTGPDGNNICITYLKYCLKEKHTFNEKVEKMFMLWNTYGIKPTENIVLEYMTACIEHGWIGSQTTILNSKCSKCNKILSQMNVSEQDFKYLLEAIKKKFAPDNMYYVTLPKEIKEFITFIDKNKPFDIIIDGLNVIYTQNYKIYKYNLIELIKTFEKQNKKILIIGRKHMKNFFEQLNIKINTFYVNNWFVLHLSHDDLFVLYAAFSSGKNAIVISKDLMRQHKFALEDTELSILFNKWQFSHQYIFDKYRGLIKLNSQVQIDAVAHKQDNYWHVPYITKIGNRQRHTCSNHWICLQMHK